MGTLDGWDEDKSRRVTHRLYPISLRLSLPLSFGLNDLIKVRLRVQGVDHEPDLLLGRADRPAREPRKHVESGIRRQVGFRAGASRGEEEGVDPLGDEQRLFRRVRGCRDVSVRVEWHKSCFQSCEDRKYASWKGTEVDGKLTSCWAIIPPILTPTTFKLRS